MQQYEKLKQIIQNSNPEISELKFGCVIISKNWGKCVIMSKTTREVGENEDIFECSDWKSIENNDTNACFVPKSYIRKVIGRPIRLADVLLAIRLSGHFKQLSFDDTVINWNFADDNLDHQSDKVKQILIQLLVPNTSKKTA